MAKAYITASKRKGSVGGETYSIVKGQTIVKAKPVQVENPRTFNQMRQRSAFLDAVKFYQHSNQNYFKMAFEDKKSTESDYNAYMRLNAGKALNITQAMANDPKWPALGSFMVSKGSLAQALLNVGTLYFTLGIKGLSADATTIGQLSSALISRLGLQDGDIFTLVCTNSSLTDVNVETCAAVYNSNTTPSWTIRQFTLNSASEALISDVLGSDVKCVADELHLYDPDPETATGMFVVFSRNTSSGLKVSNTTITMNSVGTKVIDKMMDESFIQKVLVSWGATADAVLKGGAQTQEVEPSTTQYTLTLEVSPEAGGVVTGAGTYDEGTEVPVTATANSGYAFVRWADGVTDTSRTVTMDEDKTLRAVFTSTNPDDSSVVG